MNPLDQIEQSITPYRTQLKEHILYNQLREMDDIKLFMEHHVYAVWDFMSLLKALQKELTCVTVPWTPAKNATITRFINEIVHGEESDLNEEGVPMSHFEMYIDAMDQVGANTSDVINTIEQLSSCSDLVNEINRLIPESNIAQFLQFTFEIIATGKPHLIASAFTYGREDVIPDMFLAILEKSDANNTKYNKLKYYLERHIELDGDEHGPLSLKMIAELCGNDETKWQETEEIAIKALQHRIELWNGIAERIQLKEPQLA